ncbi:MAG: hypothetical protein IPM16_11570 [Chloroflexi bacterium]|nr:hypothetical protein [Chloroflexota bacterium]
MRRGVLIFASVVLLAAVMIGGLASIQPATYAQADLTATPTLAPAFQIVGEIGRAVPRKFVYDPNFERMAIVDAYNRLLLVNALDYQTISVLHERGQYADIQFSHDGRYLAVLYNLTVELWDTESRALVASISELGGVREMLAPLSFSADDQLLMFFGSYPAPRAIRVTENQRITYPWVWHLGAARGESESTLPRGVQAIQLFDFANGITFAPKDTIIAALPSRLQVLDAKTLTVKSEIPTARFEQSGFGVYTSLFDDTVYFYEMGSSTLVQVDVETGISAQFPTGGRFDSENPAPAIDLDAVSPAGPQTIGPARSTTVNALHAQLLGASYRDANAYASRPLTITLIDIVQAPITSGDNNLLLIRVEDHEAGTSWYRLNNASAQQAVLSPDKSELMIRAYDNDQVIAFDLRSGERTFSFVPALRLGSYRRSQKNRVLAYTLDSATRISDFQRLEGQTARILAEDLRYSRRFDQFFFAPDNESVVTLAGNEWRQWSVATGEVIRREVVPAVGTLVQNSPDGTRFLFEAVDRQGRIVMEVVDYDADVQYDVVIANIPGHVVEQVVPNPSWTRFLVVYSTNPYGPYDPANQVAMFDYELGQRWLMAGDDLPSMSGRSYSWVDDDVAVIVGDFPPGTGPQRIYGVEYAANALPQCVVDRFAGAEERIWRRWERLLVTVRVDKLNEFTQLLCDTLPSSVDDLVLTLAPSNTPQIPTRTPLPFTDPVACLEAAYPEAVEDYVALWDELTTGLNSTQRTEFTRLLCEGVQFSVPSGLGVYGPRRYVMLIDPEGVRSSGSYDRPIVESQPLGPIYDLFQLTENRRLGTAVLSADQRFIAASNLPGELIVYRLLTPYPQIVAGVTATAQANLISANRVFAQATPSPTFDTIGTARPTLTPTPSLTLIPRPDVRLYDEYQSVDYCPSNALFDVSSLPAGWDATGRILAPLQDDILWAVEVEDGRRYEVEDVPACGVGVNCQLSPDNSWVLARTSAEIYVVRPDGSDRRTLWDFATPSPATPVPRDLRWSGPVALEWSGRVPYEDSRGQIRFRDGTLRDVLNVFPDPAPFYGIGLINEIPTTAYVSRQPGGPWAVAYTSYSTGISLGYKYYLIDTETGETRLFAEAQGSLMDITWHPLGDRLFYGIPLSNNNVEWFELSIASGRHVSLGTDIAPYGDWSPDGRLLALYTDYGDYPVATWDFETGTANFYCIPEDGDRGYSGGYWWSPDGEYLAIRMALPADEDIEGVGQHLLVIKLDTGEVVDLTTGVLDPFMWARDSGGYGEGVRITLTPSPSPLPTATP